MAVSVTKPVWLIPIVRRNGDTVPRKHWGKWHGQATVTGDGSAGLANLNLSLGAAGDYPPGLVWTLSWLMFYESVAAAGYIGLNIGSFELTTDGVPLSIDYVIASGAVPVLTGGAVVFADGTRWLMDFPFHFPPGTAKANLYCYRANINGTFYTFKAGGWLDYEAEV